jgi:hypothetical protein
MKSLKELYPHINSLLGDIDTSIKDYTKKIKKDTLNVIIDEKIKFLREICEGEKLNFDELKMKYLSEKERKQIKEIIDLNEIKVEELLDTIDINGTTYFYENKEKGKIYDTKTEIVGEIKEGKHILYK